MKPESCLCIGGPLHGKFVSLPYGKDFLGVTERLQLKDINRFTKNVGMGMVLYNKSYLGNVPILFTLVDTNCNSVEELIVKALTKPSTEKAAMSMLEKNLVEPITGYILSLRGNSVEVKNAIRAALEYAFQEGQFWEYSK